MTGPNPENDRDPQGDMRDPDFDAETGRDDPDDDPYDDPEGDPGSDPEEPGDQSPIQEPD